MIASAMPVGELDAFMQQSRGGGDFEELVALADWKYSTYPFFRGSPDGLNATSTTPVAHRTRAWQATLGPLPIRKFAGMSWVNARRSMMSSPVIETSTVSSRIKLVCSSMIEAILKLVPSSRWSA